MLAEEGEGEFMGDDIDDYTLYEGSCPLGFTASVTWLVSRHKTTMSSDWNP